jgi:hypothetical protein
MSKEAHRITKDDIVAPAIYASERKARRAALIPVKKNRRVEVGPYATFYFENFETMLAQVHEMLHIEKGGEGQIAGEIDTYNPLIPQGRELIATLMLEIDDAVRRTNILKRLAGIEEKIYMDVGNSRIQATPTEYEDRTTPDGKTSSVHWIRFSFSGEQIAQFKSQDGNVIIGVAHENYGHMAMVPPATRAELAKDFD